MKRAYLLAVTLVLCAGPVFAQTHGTEYDTVLYPQDYDSSFSGIFWGALVLLGFFALPEIIRRLRQPGRIPAYGSQPSQTYAEWDADWKEHQRKAKEPAKIDKCAVHPWSQEIAEAEFQEREYLREQQRKAKLL
jgi:hypothetical protein